MAVTTDELLMDQAQVDDTQDAQTPTDLEKVTPQTPTDTEQTVSTVTDNVNTTPVSQQQTSGEHIFETTTETVEEGDDEGDDEEATTGTGRLSYVQMYQQMNPYTPPTKEELEKERKKQKREAIFSAIGDGISALSNLYFTSQYSPNAYDASKGLSATAKPRFDKLKKDHEDNMRQYMQGYMQAMKMDADAAKDDRNWRHTLERERITDQYKAAAELRAEAKADRDAAMADLKMEILTHNIDKAEADARKAQIDADYRKAINEATVVQKTRQPSRGGGGKKSGGGGGGSTQTWTIVNDATGETRTVHAKSVAHAHNQVPEGWHLRNGDQVTQTETQRGRRGSKSSTSTRSYQTGGSQKKANPMGSGTGNTNNNGGKKKKKNPMS